MTVCVALKVHDCIVFTADSATSLTGIDEAGRQHVVNIYDHANKVFNLHKGLPIAGMTAGIGNFGPCSISTMSKDLRALFTSSSDGYRISADDYTLEEVANLVRKYFFEVRFASLETKPQGTFQYWIGGYSAKQDLGEIWKIHIQDGDCPAPACEAARDLPAMISWGGQTEAINRLLLGYGQGLPNALLSAGLDPEHLDACIRHVAQHTQAGLANPAMPTRDAIDLAVFLAETQKQFVRFSIGSNTVGGDLDVATVTKHEGFKWIRRKHYYSRELNPLETDHA
ncbi:hypothetical protein [Paracoccus spongiarum]|uniref:Uncharacterized protein n=1 Tax=Paracoccus spongiarum TaxID=3064387 RepID=A0ABT9JAB1_9RHOB|nr:hypothetical protein [Paracoccus sp. 2205BS29-5]MDP5306555.1 hypothetical protein [Paracoccus sp. 2205BS29-5]